jgi:hypothetical protein
VYIFIPVKFYDENIFQFNELLDEKRKMPDAEFIIDVDKRRVDDERL